MNSLFCERNLAKLPRYTWIYCGDTRYIPTNTQGFYPRKFVESLGGGYMSAIWVSYSILSSENSYTLVSAIKDLSSYNPVLVSNRSSELDLVITFLAAVLPSSCLVCPIERPCFPTSASGTHGSHSIHVFHCLPVSVYEFDFSPRQLIDRSEIIILLGSTILDSPPRSLLRPLSSTLSLAFLLLFRPPLDHLVIGRIIHAVKARVVAAAIAFERCRHLFRESVRLLSE